MTSCWWKAGLVTLLVLAVALAGSSPARSQVEVKNPGTFVEVVFGDSESLDPAWHYDTASAEIIFNVYETPIFYKRDKIDEFIPQLATVVPSVENGLVTVGPDGRTYIVFPMRKGVKFHEGGDMTPSDLEYSIERGLIQDRSGGPQWVLLEPLLGVSSIEELAEEVGDDEACARVQDAVEVNPETNSVTVKLVEPFMPVLQILAGTWGSVLDKEWVIEQGGWDGSCATWRQFHDPAAEDSELFNNMNGTGPFMLERWSPEEQETVLVRNPNYWRTEEIGPAWEGGPVGPAKLERVVRQGIDEWGTRRLMLEKGDADFVSVPRQFVDQVDPLVRDLDDSGEGAFENLREVNPEGTLRLFKNLTTNVLTTIFINQMVSEGSPYLGSGQLDGEGIPRDFFRDLNLRKCFAYAFDYDGYIEDVYLGEAEVVVGPIPRGNLGFNPDQERYTHDLEKAAQFCQQAWDGQVWEKGFKLIALYNSGNEMRKSAMEILEANVESLNPKFQIEVRDEPWPDFLKDLVRGNMGLFMLGWIEDYHDPHNWAFPFLHSQGTFAGFQGFPEELSAQLDAIIDEARVELDPDRRVELYHELQRLGFENAINIGYFQPLGRHYEQLWVCGWYYNSGYFGTYYYVLSKDAACAEPLG